MRKTLALVAALGILTALTACSGSGSSQGCDNPIVSGDASSVVTATGEFGAEPTVDFPTPLTVEDHAEVHAHHGQGRAARRLASRSCSRLTLLNGADRPVIDKTGYNGRREPAHARPVRRCPRSATALECSQVGVACRHRHARSRTASATGGTDRQSATPDSVVFVVDIVEGLPRPRRTAHRSSAERHARRRAALRTAARASRSPARPRPRR